MAHVKCNVCGKRNAKTGSKGTETSPHNDMCNYCFEEGGWENTHSDYNHDGIAEMVAKGEEMPQWAKDEQPFLGDCWICNPERNLAQQEPAKKGSTTKKVQGFRRTQLNHKEMCTHAQTPQARRTCKNAFWAGVKVMVTEGKLTEDQAWEHCIKALTANQAANAKLQALETPAKATKAPGYTLVSTGPRHGVVKQLKAAKPNAFGAAIVAGIKSAK